MKKLAKLKLAEEEKAAAEAAAAEFAAAEAAEAELAEANACSSASGVLNKRLRTLRKRLVSLEMGGVERGRGLNPPCVS